MLANALLKADNDKVYCLFGCHPPFGSLVTTSPSVWAVPLLPPVTLGNSAKLRLAKPYGLSLSKWQKGYIF